MDTILKLIYPENEIFIQPLEIIGSAGQLFVKCCVPAGSYTKNPLPYVSAENHVRILSQSCYVLADEIISSGQKPELGISQKEFREAAENFQLYYRNIAMTFHELIKKGEEFYMTLTLRSVKEFKRMDEYTLFTFESKRTAMSGEMSFVYKK